MNFSTSTNPITSGANALKVETETATSSENNLREDEILDENININSVDIRVKDSVAEAKFIVEVNNKRQLARLIRKIKKLTNIEYVERAGRL